MAFRFLAGVWRHWAAVMGGAVLGILAMLWDTYGWSANLPQWLLGLAAGSSLLCALYLTWKDEYDRATRAEAQLDKIEGSRPQALFRPIVDRSMLVLEIRNDGAQGTFQATIETLHEKQRLVPLPALWEPDLIADPVFIPHGEARRLRLAGIDEDRTYRTDDEGNDLLASYGWTLQYKQPARGLNRATWRTVVWPGPGKGKPVEWFTLRVVVTWDPPLSNRTAMKLLKFVDREIIDLDSGERYVPTPIIRDEGGQLIQ